MGLVKSIYNYFDLEIEPTIWELKSSASGGYSAMNFRAKGGQFVIGSKTRPDFEHRFQFAGAGIGHGASITKSKFSLACKPFPRAGALYKMRSSRGEDLSLDEICGGFVMYESAGHVMAGGNAFVMFIGGMSSQFLSGLASCVGTPAVYVPAMIRTSRAFICSTGMTVTTDIIPIDAGWSAYVGAIVDFSP